MNQLQRRDLERSKLQSGYTKVLDYYNHLIESGKFSEAVLIGSSLFEERVTSCWLIREWWERSNSFELEFQQWIYVITTHC